MTKWGGTQRQKNKTMCHLSWDSHGAKAQACDCKRAGCEFDLQLGIIIFNVFISSQRIKHLNNLS